MERGNGKYELPEEKIFDTNIFSFPPKKTERGLKIYSLVAVTLKIKKINSSLKLAVVHFILSLISETILASSRIEH